MAVSNQPSHQVHQEVDRAAMTRMLDLADILELIIDRFNDGPLAQEQFVRHLKQAVVHLFAQLRDEVNALGDQEVLRERLGKIAFGVFEFARSVL
jgi:hypothetical protein